MSEEMQNESVEQAQPEQSATQEAPNWIDNLPEDIREGVSKFSSPEELAKGYINLEQYQGNSIRIPSEDAGKEQLEEFYSKLDKIPGIMRRPDNDDTEAMNQFYNQIGRPESPENYSFEIPEDIPINEEAAAQFKQLAYDMGLTKEQATKLVNYELERANAIKEQTYEQIQSAQETLKKAWGNDYDVRLEGAKSVLNVYKEQFPEAVEQLVNGPAGNNPAIIAMLSELGRSMQEKGHVGSQNTPKYGVTPQEALAQIDDIMMNRSHAYHNSDDPNHKAAVEKMSKLYQAAYPNDG